MKILASSCRGGLWIIDTYRCMIYKVSNIYSFGILLFPNGNIVITEYNNRKTQDYFPVLSVSLQDDPYKQTPKCSSICVDGSAHYIQVIDNTLIVQETYLQNFRFFQLGGNGSVVQAQEIFPYTQPFPFAVNYHYLHNPKFASCKIDDYMHINAFAKLHDDHICVSATFLGRKPGSKCYEDKPKATLELLDPSWKRIKTIHLTDNVIHDIIVHNNDIWYAADHSVVCLEYPTFFEKERIQLPIVDPKPTMTAKGLYVNDDEVMVACGYSLYVMDRHKQIAKNIFKLPQQLSQIVPIMNQPIHPNFLSIGTQLLNMDDTQEYVYDEKTRLPIHVMERHNNKAAECFPLFTLGRVPITPFLPFLPFLPLLDILETNRATEPIPIYWTSYSWRCYEKLTRYAFDHTKYMIPHIENVIAPLIKKYYMCHHLCTCMIVILPVDGEIPIHADSGEFLTLVRRVYIPLQTNQNVEYTIDGKIHQFQEGYAYEINNCMSHGVKNKGETDEIHLVIDFLPNKFTREIVEDVQNIQMLL